MFVYFNFVYYLPLEFIKKSTNQYEIFEYTQDQTTVVVAIVPTNRGEQVVMPTNVEVFELQVSHLKFPLSRHLSFKF